MTQTVRPLGTSKRRLVALAALPLVGSLALAACGSDSGDGGSADKAITISYPIANPKADSAFKVLAEEYEKTHPGVTIKTNAIALNSYNSTMTTQMQAGNGPDILYVNPGTGQAASVGELAKAGMLLDLSGTVDESIVPASSKDLFTSDGKLVALPPYLNPFGVVFSPRAAEENGVTITAESSLDNVIAQCSSTQKKGVAVFGLAGAMAPNTGMFAVQLAGDTVYGPDPEWNAKRAKGEVTFADSDGWKAALGAIKDLYDADCFQKGAAGAGFDALTNGMGQGKMTGFAAPAGAAKDIMDSTKGAVTLTVLPMPAPSGYSPYVTAGTADGVAGNAKTKNPELVKDFLSWMTEPAQAAKAADSIGAIPIGEIDTSKLLPQYEGVKGLLTEGKTAPVAYLGWPNGEVYDALGTGVTGLLTGQKSVADVLEAMDKAWG